MLRRATTTRCASDALPLLHHAALTSLPSSSTSQIVRADYADPLYQSFAIKAIEQWRTPRWKKHFYECGVVVAAAETDPQAGYVVNSHRLNKEEDVGRLERAGGIKRFYSASIGTGEFPGDVACESRLPSSSR